MSDLQSNLAEFIRRLGVDDDRLGQLDRRVTALGQGIRNLWTDGLGGSNACLTTITGTITGGLGTALAGSTIQITGSTSGTNYGTFTATDGAYSLAFVLDVADTSLNLIVTGPGPRFTAKAPVIKSVIQCVSNPVANIQAQPASGYHYSAGVTSCQYPLKDALTFVDSFYGTHTINWLTGSAWISACSLETTPASTCPSVTTGMKFAMAGGPQVGWHAIGGGCPIPLAACPIPPGQEDSISYGGLTAMICPDDTPTLFDATWTIPAGTDPKIHGAAAQTIRIYET